MSAITKIEWSDRTWSPVRGCSRVSAGCGDSTGGGCYAERQAHRFSGPGKPYEGLTRMTERGPRWTGKIRLVPEALDEPLRWRKPQRIFVASMSDPHHDGVPDEFRDKMLAVIAASPRHTYQWLTKRAEAMRAYFSDPKLPFRVLRQIDALEVDEAMRGVEQVWRPVAPASLYEVSNYGWVRRGLRELALVSHGGGYRQVAICQNGEPRTALVHRLVLEAFDRPARAGEEVAHRNGDRADNRLANLRWATKSENMADAARHGTAGAWMKSRATVTAAEVEDIRSARRRGELLATVAARYGIAKQHVSAIATGKIFKPATIDWPLPNVHLGVSVENQETADERIPLLLQTAAAVRWISAEPLLGPIYLDAFWKGSCWTCLGSGEVAGDYFADDNCRPCPDCRRGANDDNPGLDWGVVGGESGPGARPCDIAWVRSIIEHYKAARRPVFVKQLGARPVDSRHCDVIGTDQKVHYRRPADNPFIDDCRRRIADGRAPGYRIEPSALRLRDRKGGDMAEWPSDLRVREFPAAQPAAAVDRGEEG